MSILPPPPDSSPQACRDDPTSVYRYYDKSDVLLYVGITSRGIARNIEHNKSKDWFQFVTRQVVEHYPSRDLALKRETRLIRAHRPPFNRQQNPAHEMLRDAYMRWGALPKLVQDARTPVGGALPKTLWFIASGKVHEDSAILFLDTPMPRRQWRADDRPRLVMRDEDKGTVGRLHAFRMMHGLHTLEVRSPRAGVLLSVAVGVKWPPAAGRLLTVEFLNARAFFNEGTR